MAWTIHFWLRRSVWRLGSAAGGDASLWPRAVGALPQVILVALAVGLVLQPIINAILRGFETACDRDALAATGSATYRSAFEKLASMSMADPEPSRIIEVFFYDHPPISKRLALAGPAGPIETTETTDEPVA